VAYNKKLRNIKSGALDWLAHRAHLRRDAVAALKPANGTIMYDWQFKDGRLIRNGKPWEPKWLLDILGIDFFHDATMIALFSGRVTDADMACLGNLTRIDTLVLNPSSVSDVGLAHIDQLINVRWLSIGSSLDSTDALITRLVRLKTLNRIHGLNLDRSSVTDDGLGRLDGLTSLELLGLEGTRVSDAGLARLSRLTALKMRLPQWYPGQRRRTGPSEGHGQPHPLTP
jgi:internalin A